MERRIFGLENEYGVTCTLRGQRRLSPDEVARYLFRRVVSWGRSSNVFLENGARLYLDVGSHPEFATPECDSIEDVVAHDKAGERILEGLVKGAEERLEEEGIRGEIYVFKNNTDSAGNSYGCHENYLVSRHKDFHRTVDILIPFLVTRQIFLGAGKLVQTPRGTTYSLAQRADHIWEGVSSATTRSRPIINTRDEPHADPEKYRRLHVIVGDANMSELTNYLKVGTTAIALSMLEDDFIDRDLTLDNPVQAFRAISRDLACRTPVRMKDGRAMTAVAIQREFLEPKSCAPFCTIGCVHRVSTMEVESANSIVVVAFAPTVYALKQIVDVMDVPQVSALAECRSAADGQVPLIADGGVKRHGLSGFVEHDLPEHPAGTASHVRRKRVDADAVSESHFFAIDGRGLRGNALQRTERITPPDLAENVDDL